jgi:hypothetical protein
LFSEVTTIVVLLGFGALGWWVYRFNAAWKRKRQEEEREFGRHDHTRAHEIAKAQADLQRWSGPQ